MPKIIQTDQGSNFTFFTILTILQFYTCFRKFCKSFTWSITWPSCTWMLSSAFKIIATCQLHRVEEGLGRGFNVAFVGSQGLSRKVRGLVPVNYVWAYCLWSLSVVHDGWTLSPPPTNWLSISDKILWSLPEQHYLIEMPGKIKSTILCHVNLVKT